jgi:hypothetical protein
MLITGRFLVLALVVCIVGAFAADNSGAYSGYFNDNNWEDLRFPVSAIRLGGTAPASDQGYRGGMVLSFSSAVDNYVYLTIQLPHSWREGDNVTAHIHWTIPVGGLGGGAENVKWDLTYSWANMDDTFPVQSSETMTRNVATIAANTHLYDEWVELNGAGKTTSSMIIISIKRDTTVANDYASTALLLEFDIHYRQDRFGSPTPLD